MLGSTIGNYQILAKLGEGGMGAVYKGVDLMVEREVAIKVLRPQIAAQPELVERFHAEAVALARLNHPCIATLYSFFRAGDEYFMVMEFVPGRTLEALLRESGAMPVETSFAIARQVLEALEHAHSIGILHRDIKPANIMLTASGQVKVTDFGIARVLGHARMTREGSLCGTPEYLAPERIRGQEADLRSDLYSLGVVLYEMLSGHLPFAGGNEYELMRAHLEQQPPPFSGSVAPEVEQIVARALAKDPAGRFATAGEFHKALAGLGTVPLPQQSVPVSEEAIAQAPSSNSAAQPPSTALRVSSKPRLRWALYAGAAVVLVTLGLILAFTRGGTPSSPEPAKSVTAPATAQPVTPAQTEAAAPQTTSPEVSAPDQGKQDVPERVLPEGKSPARVSGVTKRTPPANGAEARRKAALQALEKDDSASAAKKQKDRRASSIEALKKQ